MNYPNSLHEDLLARSFFASNGEIGVLLEDTDVFLSICLRENVAVLGWEVWLSDFTASTDGMPIPAKGRWHGLVPSRNGGTSMVIGGETSNRLQFQTWNDFVTHSVALTVDQLSATDFANDIDPQYLKSLRINFALQSEEEFIK